MAGNWVRRWRWAWKSFGGCWRCYNSCRRAQKAWNDSWWSFQH